jgi:rubrerythrin
MSIRFSADEVLSVAERIEVNGARFYEAASSRVASVAAQRLLHDLAAWETTHQQTFAEMRRQLPPAQRDANVQDPDGEVADYLQTFADTHVFDSRLDPLGQLGENPSYRDILQAAIGMEKDSIVFYQMMKSLVPASLGTGRIDAILREESRHLALLTKELAEA